MSQILFNCSLLFLVFSIFSCVSEKTEYQLHTLIVDIEKVTKGKVSDYFEAIDYVWFDDESNPEASIGVFHRIIEHKNRYYLFDEDICVCFYIFSSEGLFIKKVKGFGEGPGSYQYPSSFQIIKDTIRLNDISQNKILHFDLDGNWIKDTPQQLSVNEIYIDKTGSSFHQSMSYLLNNSKNQIRVFDSKGDLSFEGFPYDARISALKVKNRMPFIELDKGVIFKDDYLDTIYIIKGFNAEPYLAFDFKGKGFKNRDFNEVQDLDHFQIVDFINKRSPPHFMGRAVISDKFFLGGFKYLDGAFIATYDFEEKTSKVHHWQLVNDIDEGPGIYLPDRINEEWVYTYTTGKDLYLHIKSLQSKMTSTDWEEFQEGKGKKLVSTAKRAGSSENRILILLKWKK